MLDSYIIDFLKEEERKKYEEARIPLYIHPPELDEYRDDSYDSDNTNKKRYIEIDISGNNEENPNTIKM